MNAQASRKKSIQERTTYIDLRIGLILLGENGRRLLAQYIASKRGKKDSVSTS